MSHVRGPAVLSIDFEFFSHTPACRSARGALDDPTVGLSAMDGLLAALDSYGARATFFVVSEVAERHPDAISRAADAGHEIASHTHTHRHLPDLDAGERREELETSRETLADVTGADVAGFRAPSFDIAPGHFEAVADAGYGYDSSVAPCRSIPGWYGGEYDVREPVPVSRLGSDADLAELPIGVMPGLRLPLTGAWLRLFGVRYTLAGMDLLARSGVAPVLYVHPWEFVDLPDVAGVPRRVYWRTGEWMCRALDRILNRPYEFVTARELLEERL